MIGKTMNDDAEQLYQDLIKEYPRIGILDAAKWAVRRIAEAIAAEREACAKVVLDSRTLDVRERRAQYERDPRSVDRYWLGWDDALTEAAAAIRARGEGKER